MAQTGEGTFPGSHSKLVNWSQPRSVSFRWAWVGAGQQLGDWISVVAGTSVMAGTFQVLSSPQPCTGSRALCFLPGLGKEGPFQVTLLSLSPPPHQTFLCGLEPRVSRFPGWGLHRATNRGFGDGEETGAEASGMESGARLGHPHSSVQIRLHHAPAL